MRPRLLAVALLIFAALAAVTPASAGAATSVPDWPQYHGGAYRAGYASTMPAYKSGLHITKKIALDGAVYAQPIVANGLTIVATENDTVYAFDSNNTLVWQKHLGTPVPRNALPCGDIDPLGITGTPLYDPSNKTIYVAGELDIPPVVHELFALSVTTGQVIRSTNIDTTSEPGISAGAMQQRGALALAQGKIWVPFGGLAGDCSSYRGQLVGVPLNGGGNEAFTVPTSREGGIWAPPGPTVDPQGNLFVAVGNGAAGQGVAYDYTDSVLKISGADATRLDSFSPTTWATDNENDLDLGSQGPAFIRGFVFSAGKSGTAYVLRRTQLGGIGGQVSKTSLCTASFGGTAVVGNTVYVPCTNGVRAVWIDTTGHMHLGWRNTAATGSPVYGGGMIWTLDTSGGVLLGLGLHDGAQHVHVAVGAVNRFATPAISGRRILVGTLSGLTVLSF